MNKPNSGSNSKENLHFVLLLISLVITTWLYTFNQNIVHINALKQFVHWLCNPRFTFPTLNFDGLFYAILGTIQILFLGTIVTKTLLFELEDKFEARLVSIAMGYGFAGLMVILLGYLRLLYIAPLLLILWILATVFIVFHLRRGKLYAVKSYLRDCFNLWKPSKPQRPVWILFPAAIILVLFLAAYYHAIVFPPLEYDSIIYHAPMASILFKEYGLPFIAGGGVGIGLSANYPLLFSALGSYYYLWIGFVQDLFLRIITPTMGLLSILATYCLGKEVGGRKLGIISAYLFSIVPAYLSYSSLATHMTTITFFLIMGVLFFLKAIGSERIDYWIVSGVLFGFALLASYQTLYYIPPLFMLLCYFWFRNRTLGLNNLKRIFMLIFPMIMIGGAPYLRNWLVLGNPVYPFFNELFDSPFISPWIFEHTMRSLNYVASFIATGKNTPSMLEFLFSLFTYPSFYPLNFLLFFPATLIFLSSKVRAKLLIVTFVFIPLLAMILNTPFFIRYFWLVMPYISVIVGYMFIRGFEGCNIDVLLVRRCLKAILLILLSAMAIFASFPAISGYAYTFVAPSWPKNEVSYDYLRYTMNPNMDRGFLLNLAYGSDALAWQWLNNNLRQGDRVATFESRIYYIKNADYKTLFFLDNMEAQDLYHKDQPAEVILFLQQKNVKYIFTKAMEEQGLLMLILPLSKFLGSPQFPIVFEDGLSKVYKVGSLEADPIVTTPSLAYIGPNGWSNLTWLDGIVTRAVISGSVSPRLYVLTTDLVEIDIHYLDKGQGSLAINIYNPYSKRWIHNYKTIEKEDTREWKCYKFLAPIDIERGFVELGLYAHGEDFVISKICASYVKLKGRETITSLAKARITNSTIPPSIMIYLPILGGEKRLYVSSHSYGKKISIEVFEGYVPIGMTTDWWLEHRMVARTPELPTFGTENPILSWETKEGIYTLLIVLWDKYEPDSKVDLSITIGGSK